MHQDSNKKDEILHAAEAEFLEKGFSGARTISIAQAAGVTHTMLHYYFHTKEELFERVVNSKLTVMIDSIFESLNQISKDVSLIESIESFTTAHYVYLSQNDHLPLFVLNEVIQNPERLEIFKTVLADKLKSIDLSFGKRYLQAVATGEITPIDILTLISDILMLNLSSILMRPLFQNLKQISTEEYDTWRIKENLTIIRRRIRP